MLHFRSVRRRVATVLAIVAAILISLMVPGIPASALQVEVDPPPSPQCPAGYTLQDDLSCTQVVDKVLTPPQCPDDATGGTPGSCVFEFPATDGDPECPAGTLVGNECHIVGDAPTLQSACPDDFPLDPVLGFCARFEPASFTPASCPLGSRGDAPDDCYILQARLPAMCPEDSGLIDSQCIILGDPPVVVDSDCQTSLDVIETLDGCFRIVAETDVTGECVPAGASGCLIDEPLTDITGCLDPTFGQVGDSCVKTVGLLPPACSDETVEDADGNCRLAIPADDPTPFCDDPAAALNGTSCIYTTGFIFVPTCADGLDLIGAECFEVVAAVVPLVCFSDSIEPDASGVCTLPVADKRQLEVCPATSSPVGDECVVSVASARCNASLPSWFDGDLNCSIAEMGPFVGDSMPTIATTVFSRVSPEADLQAEQQDDEMATPVQSAAAASASRPDAGPSPILAVTGVETATLAMLGLGLFATGAAANGVARCRRNRE